MPINHIQFQPGLSLPKFFAQFGTESQFEAALERARGRTDSFARTVANTRTRWRIAKRSGCSSAGRAAPHTDRVDSGHDLRVDVLAAAAVVSGDLSPHPAQGQCLCPGIEGRARGEVTCTEPMPSLGLERPERRK